MRRREEASSQDWAERPLGQNDGRVPPSRTKPGLVVTPSPWRTTNAVRSLGGMARPAFMPGKWFVSLTDEVPRSSSLGSISSIYKAKLKGSGEAPAAGTATPWPRLQGCLQRHSTPSLRDAGKAKPQSDSSGLASSWDKLASAKKRSPYAWPATANGSASGGEVLPRRRQPPIPGPTLRLSGSQPVGTPGPP